MTLLGRHVLRQFAEAANKQHSRARQQVMARAVAVLFVLVLAASESVATRVGPNGKQLEGPAAGASTAATEAGERRYQN